MLVINAKVVYVCSTHTHTDTRRKKESVESKMLRQVLRVRVRMKSETGNERMGWDGKKRKFCRVKSEHAIGWWLAWKRRRTSTWTVGS